ncbi:MAG: hypothetical protein R6V04_01275 [bacterium]
MVFNVQPVQTKKDLKKFIKLPYELYKNDPYWVAPLLYEEKRKYTARFNPMLEHCDYQHFLLFKNGTPVGRISVYINHFANENWGETRGLFGSYECIDDKEGARLLFQSAYDWLKQKNAVVMQGPWGFSQECGLLIDDFHSSPMIMSPYNPAYYPDQLECSGLKKAKDVFVYKVDEAHSYTLPQKYSQFAKKIAVRYGVTVRSIDIKNIKQETKLLVKIANESTRDNWGYMMVSENEAEHLAGSLKLIVDPDIIMLAEINGKPIGYMIVLPDINIILKKLRGKLFPFGIFKLQRGIRNIRNFRVWGLGILPEYRRKAIDILFYNRLYEILSPKKPGYVEANYVLEDNMVMNNPIKKLGFTKAKTYRVYEKVIQ